MPGFVDYMYKNILPACFLAPLEPNFDLNDGNSFVVLGEIAGALKAMINARGGETIAYLQSDYLPTLRMPPPVLEVSKFMMTLL
jgi:exportin-T